MNEQIEELKEKLNEAFQANYEADILRKKLEKAQEYKKLNVDL
jgi:hypothetical protein